MSDARESLFPLPQQPAQMLNPYLYGQLSKYFDPVVIAKQGENSSGSYGHDGRDVRYNFVHTGEYYRVNCPFCSQKQAVDTRQRLWINHRWGIGPPENDRQSGRNDKLWWTCLCYNEDCMANPENVKALRTRIYGGVGRETHAPEIQLVSHAAPLASLGIVDWPGRCLRVDQLPASHTAYQYLLSRGFDPGVLGQMYDVSFCQELDPKYPMAHNKLIIPIYMNGKMVSWQARPPYDIDWKAARQPKYYNCPGTNKRLMLYNCDNSKSVPFCTIVEGVTDVWAHGPGTVSLLGKMMAPVQAELIIAHWDAAVLVLDPDAAEQALEIKQRLATHIPTALLTLPAGMDPATVDKEYFWDMVLIAAQQQGVELPS